MEMEFKDSSRRRTLVLVVGVLLALAAGAAAFMLSSQGSEAPDEVLIPTKNVVVAAEPLPARVGITATQVQLRPVAIDDSNAEAFSDTEEVVGRIPAIAILTNQIITPNMFVSDTGSGAVPILKPDETVAPDSPILRAVSITVPSDRAVGGLIGEGQRVDLIATFPMAVTLPVDPETGETAATAIDPETGQPVSYVAGSSTKLMWLDTEIIVRNQESAPDVYILRVDLQTAEEIAHAQNQGAQFTMVLRPPTDTRDVDRSNYGETTDTLLTRYNFRVPENIDGVTYPQPIAFPSPFPAEPYLSPAPVESAAPSPVSAPTAAPEASPAP
jgi:Flp pilus assembly protein CpaB